MNAFSDYTKNILVLNEFRLDYNIDVLEISFFKNTIYNNSIIEEINEEDEFDESMNKSKSFNSSNNTDI